MDINVWTEEETNYCVTQLKLWRSKTFREQEVFISQMKVEGNLSQSEEEIRFRCSYLDRLTNGEIGDYELLTIPQADKKLNGICKKEKE